MATPSALLCSLFTVNWIVRRTHLYVIEALSAPLMTFVLQRLVERQPLYHRIVQLRAMNRIQSFTQTIEAAAAGAASNCSGMAHAPCACTIVTADASHQLSSTQGRRRIPSRTASERYGVVGF